MTDRQKKLWVTPEALENQQKRQCLPDLIEPVYVARMVLFLASDLMCTANFNNKFKFLIYVHYKQLLS